MSSVLGGGGDPPPLPARRRFAISMAISRKRNSLDPVMHELTSVFAHSFPEQVEREFKILHTHVFCSLATFKILHTHVICSLATMFIVCLQTDWLCLNCHQRIHVVPIALEFNRQIKHDV